MAKTVADCRPATSGRARCPECEPSPAGGILAIPGYVTLSQDRAFLQTGIMLSGQRIRPDHSRQPDRQRGGGGLLGHGVRRQYREPVRSAVTGLRSAARGRICDEKPEIAPLKRVAGLSGEPVVSRRRQTVPWKPSLPAASCAGRADPRPASLRRWRARPRRVPSRSAFPGEGTVLPR